tara:strand:- start:871 stop:1323 length:453 start_codon:yes stop_codon:yes gene_type:complete
MAVTAGVLAVVAIAGTVYSADQEQKAAKEQTKAAKKAKGIDRRMASIKNQREKRKAIAQSRLQQSALQNAAGNTNTLGSSGAQGGLASSGAGLAGGIGFQNTVVAGADASGRALQRGADRAAVHLNRAQMGAAISGGSSQASSLAQSRAE